MESEMRGLQKELGRWMKRCESLEERARDQVVLEAENERLRFGSGVMAEQYAEVYDSLQIVRQAASERDIALLQAQRIMEAELQETRLTTSDIAEEKEGLAHRLSLAQGYIGLLERALDDAIISRQDCQQLIRVEHITDDQIAPLAPFVGEEQIATVLDLALGHAHFGQECLQESRDHITHLRKSVIDLEVSVSQGERSLSVAQSALNQLQTEHEVLRSEHAPCGASMSQLRYELDQSNQIVDNRGAEVNEVRLRLCKADERSERQADILKRANENVSRAKFAQEALEEEVEQ